MLSNNELIEVEEFLLASSSMARKISSTLSENQCEGEFLFRFAVHNAFSKVDCKKNNHSIIFISACIAVGWLVGFFLYFGRLAKPKHSDSSCNHLVLHGASPNQRRTRDNIFSDIDSACGINFPGIRLWRIRKSGFFSIKYGVAGFGESFKRAPSLLLLAGALRGVKYVSFRQLFKLGFNLSPSCEFSKSMGKAVLEAYPSVRTVYFTYTGYWADLVAAKLNENSVKTVLNLHGSVGNSLEYRTVSQKTIVPEKLDAYLLSQVSGSKLYESTTPVGKVNLKTRKPLDKMLYCTNLFSYGNGAGGHLKKKAFAAGASCNMIVSEFRKLNEGKVIVRKHPREKFEDVTSSLGSCSLYTRDDSDQRFSCVIAHESSVVFEYLFSHRVYVYRAQLGQVDDEFGAIKRVSDAIGFSTHEELVALSNLSDATYCERVCSIVGSESYSILLK